MPGRFLIFASLLMFALTITGCGNSKKSSRNNPVPSGGTGIGTGTGTGTSTSTGTGGNIGGAEGIDLRWATEPQADQAWLEAMADRIANAGVSDGGASGGPAAGIWKSTEGQGYLRNQTLTSGSTDAEIVFKNLDSDSVFGGAAGACESPLPGSPRGYRIYLGGRFYLNCFLHEFCHGEYKRGPEEYSCSVCAMASANHGGPNPVVYCHSGNCMSSNPCWENYITKAYPGWSYTGGDPGNHPSCTVTIQ